MPHRRVVDPRQPKVADLLTPKKRVIWDINWAVFTIEWAVGLLRTPQTHMYLRPSEMYKWDVFAG
jgi:hypothetical protein